MIAIDSLLEPISPEMPCGEDLSFSREFDEIREARREDDPNLAQGDWVSDLKVADWDFVAEQCEALLSSKSKDLRVAGWFAEALCKTQGFAGLAAGCDLLRGLMERYWDDLHPLAEDGDQELRIGTLSWLVAQSAHLLRHLPLTRGAKGAFSYADYESARAFHQALEKNPDLADEMPAGKVTLEQVQEAQKATGREVYVELVKGFDACHEAWQKLSNCIDERLGVDGPSFREVFNSFDSVGNLLKRVAKERGALASNAADVVTENAAQESPGLAANDTMARGPIVMAGPIQSRAQALQMLNDVSEFFRRTEPHSPVAYLAQKAVDWGNMPLHEWLKLVVKDGGALAHIQEMLGVSESE